MRTTFGTIRFWLLLFLLWAATAAAAAQEDTFRKVSLLVDLSDYQEGAIGSWLAGKGFEPVQDARDRRKIGLGVASRALVVSAQAPVEGYFFNEGVDLEAYSAVRIQWGVNDFPAGTSFEKRQNGAGLLVMIFFSYDKISPNRFAMSSSPYFLAFYLDRRDPVEKAYTGRFFQRGGRFICLGNPSPGETVVSHFELLGALRSYFEKDEIPLITGIALGVNTTASREDGRASAFIRSIEFLE